MLVCLSPHFDDAVYSLGAMLAQAKAQGEDVHVITIMAGEPTQLPDSPIVADLHARWQTGASPVKARLTEDQTALQHLGVTKHYLTIPDCIYRTDDACNALYADETSLFGGIHPADSAPTQLRALDLQTILGVPLSDCTLYAPLAVGDHVDHHVVRQWALSLADEAHALYLYADFPYIRESEALDKALQAITITLKDAPHFVTEQAILRKVEAATKYASQLSTFWEDEADLKQDILTIFQAPTSAHAPYVEKCWRVI
jgi:LmbE family N-acetylglucosaminyl deacetylase